MLREASDDGWAGREETTLVCGFGSLSRRPQLLTAPQEHIAAQHSARIAACPARDGEGAGAADDARDTERSEG